MGRRQRVLRHFLGHFHFNRHIPRQVLGCEKTGKERSLRARARRTDEVAAPAAAFELSVEAFDRYVGGYELAPGFVMTVRREGDRFLTRATGQPEIEIFAISENAFRPDVVDATLTFELGEDGKGSALTLEQGTVKLRGERVD